MKLLNKKPTKNKILFCQHNNKNIFSSISWEWIIPQTFLPSFYAFSSQAFSFFLKANSLKQEMLFPGLKWITVFLSIVLT